MGVLRLPGLVTGIDTSELIRQLMIVNSRRLANYQVKKLGYEGKKDTLDELRGIVGSVKASSAALADSGNMQSFNSSSSDTDVLTVSASSDAQPGSHSVIVNQLATTETWVHDDANSTFTQSTDYVGGGNFIYSYNYKERIITTVADDTTLEDLVNLINNDEENPGVAASLLYQGGIYHLMLNGRQTGTDYQISINNSNTQVYESSTGSTASFTDGGDNATLTTRIRELDQFTVGDGLQGDEHIDIIGKDHFNILVDVDFDITTETTVGHLIDAINDAYGGTATAILVNSEIRLTDHTYGSSDLEITLGYYSGVSGNTSLTLPDESGEWDVTTGGTISAGITKLDPDDFTETQSAQDSKIRIDGYPSRTVAEVQTLTPDAAASSGDFTLSYGGETTAPIDRMASITDIQDALELLSTVSTGDITVSGGTQPIRYGTAVTFTFLGTAGDVELIEFDFSGLTGPTQAGSSIVETTKGDAGWLERNSNSISDALTGITLNLYDVSEYDETEQEYTSIKVTLTRNTALVRTRVQSMVNAYNKLMTYLRTNTEYNAETKKMGILSTDIAVSLIKSQIRDPFIGVLDGFTGALDTFIQASDIGITVDGHGMLEFDTGDLDAAIGENYMDVLYLLGATATGNSSNTTIDFYNASDIYTTAGTYHVQVEIIERDGSNVIDSAQVKLSSESVYRDMTVDGNLITGDSTFDSGGNPIYPENALQLTVDLTSTGTFTATIHVKQGMAGVLEDYVDTIMEADGRIEGGDGVYRPAVQRRLWLLEESQV